MGIASYYVLGGVLWLADVASPVKTKPSVLAIAADEEELIPEAP